MRAPLTVILLVASTALTAFSVAALPYYFRTDRVTLPVITAVLWLLFAASLWALRGVRGRAGVAIVLLGAVALGGAAMAGPPNTSTDSARYAWDGIVQNAGISPYAHVPADPALEELRPEWLFPEPVVEADGELGCEGQRIMTFEEVGTGEVLCTAINRANVPTIYPPVAQAAFAAVRFLVPVEAEYWPMQALGLLISLAITGLLLSALHRAGRDPRWAALWAWCPLVATEAVTNSHIDVLGALLLVLATMAAASNRRWLAGIALGASIATKLIPVIGAPAIARPGWWRIALAAVAVFLLVYIPAVVSDGPGVLGYLPGYLSEEGYESGERFIMLSWLAPGLGATVLAGALLAVAAVLVWRKTDPADPWLGQLILIGVVLLVVTPRYSWYALLLLPMIAMTGRWEWLLVPLALTERLLFPDVAAARIAVVLAIVGVLIGTVRRAQPGWNLRVLEEIRHPLRRPIRADKSRSEAHSG